VFAREMTFYAEGGGGGELNVEGRMVVKVG